MPQTILKKTKLIKFLGVSLMVLLFGSYISISAIDNPYQAGETLDPNCVPGEANCTVFINGVSVDTTLLSVYTDLLGSPSQLHSVFLGYQAGYGTDFSGGGGDVGSNFLGYQAGYNATYSTDANFLGTYAGMDATTASKSNFIGYSAGNNAGVANDSNFIGTEAGINAYNASYSNFIGYNAGNHANLAPYSNFIGFEAGFNAYEADNSNFLGNNSGSGASFANNSNFLGQFSGSSATNAFYSNFLGYYAGASATNARASNFFGESAGYSAANASNSIFMGNYSGSNAVNSSNSIFIGQQAGYNDTVNNTTLYDDITTFANTSILIGHKTSTGSYSNSIALGAYATNTATNQFMIGSTTRPINTTVWKGTSTTATLDTATGLITTSDERLKTNIEDLPDNTLDKLINVRTVNFNWLNGDNNKTNIGFIAQDLEQYFPELVYTNNDENNYKGVNYANMTPILVEAIREMNLKLGSIADMEKENTWRNVLVSWFSNASNNIVEFIAGTIRAKDKLCVGEGSEEVCVTKEELLQMKNNLNINNNSNSNSEEIETTEEVETEVETEIDSSEENVVENDIINGSEPEIPVVDDNSSDGLIDEKTIEEMPVEVLQVEI